MLHETSNWVIIVNCTYHCPYSTFVLENVIAGKSVYFDNSQVDIIGLFSTTLPA